MRAPARATRLCDRPDAREIIITIMMNIMVLMMMMMMMIIMMISMIIMIMIIMIIVIIIIMIMMITMIRSYLGGRAEDAVFAEDADLSQRLRRGIYIYIY